MKIFRKIRQQLAADNNIAKYLRYAIGEILLVVIGILIALQINTWNGKRIKKAEIANIYVSILEELNTDILLLEEYLPVFNWKNAKLNKIVYEEIPIEEWVNNDSLFKSFYSFPDFEISQQRFELLKTKVYVDDETKKLNRDISDFYHKHTANLNIKNREASVSFNRNISYWEENEDWLSLAYVKGDYSKLGVYASENPIFRNKMMWYRIVLRRLERALREYQAEAIIVSEDIKQYLNRNE